MLFFDLLILLEIILLLFQHLAFPLFLKIVLHMMTNFLHIFFVLRHTKYQKLKMIFQNLKVLLLLPFYLLVFLDLCFLSYVPLLLLLLFYHSFFIPPQTKINQRGRCLIGLKILYYIFAAFSRRNTYLRFRSLLQEFSIVST